MIDLIGFLVLAAALLVAARYRATSAEDYTVASRALGLFPLVATLVMTEFNTSTLLAFAATGYTAGPMALAMPLVFLVGLAFYTLTVARAWKRFDRTSVGEFFAARYSPRLGRAASAFLLLAMVGFTSTYVKSMTLLFSPFVPPGVPEPILAAGLTLAVLTAILPGGLTAIVRTDVVGFVVTVMVVIALAGIGWDRASALGGLGSAFAPDQLRVNPLAQWQHPVLPFRFVSTLIVLTCFTYIAAPWYGQKVFAARDERTAVRAVGWSATLVFLLYGLAVLAAAFLRVTHPQLADPQLAIPVMVRDWLPAGVRGAAFAVLFGAAFTTLAGVWSAMAAMVATDFTGTGPDAMARQRHLVSGVAVLSWVGSVTLGSNILDRLILANIPVAALAFALLAGFHWKRASTAGAWASMVVGISWGIGCFVLVGEAGGYTWPWAMYGIPLVLVVGIVASLLRPNARPRPGN